MFDQSSISLFGTKNKWNYTPSGRALTDGVFYCLLVHSLVCFTNQSCDVAPFNGACEGGSDDGEASSDAGAFYGAMGVRGDFSDARADPLFQHPFSEVGDGDIADDGVFLECSESFDVAQAGSFLLKDFFAVFFEQLSEAHIGLEKAVSFEFAFDFSGPNLTVGLLFEDF